MRNRFPDRSRRSVPSDDAMQQPGLPAGEARLLDVRRQEGSVFLALDDGSTLELAAASVPAGLPAPGEMIGGDLLAEIRLAAERKLVARMILAALDRRLQPMARLRDKALEKGYSEQAVDAVLEQMAARGLYSDRQFAEAYCRDCLATRAVGRHYLVGKLRQKQVPASLAAEVADMLLDDGAEELLADRAAAARWKKIRGAGDLKDVARVVRHLQSRGFDAGTSNRAARRTRPGDTTD